LLRTVRRPKVEAHSLETIMDSNLRSTPSNRLWATLAGSRRAKAIGLVLIVIVPGGFVVPACYAVYHAIRHSLSK
jgi:hypothetical protein